MKRFAILLCLIGVMFSCKGVDGVLSGETLSSPDGKLSMVFALSDAGEPMYSLSYDGKPVIRPSHLGYTLRGEFKGGHPQGGTSVKEYGTPRDLCKGFSLLDVARDSLDETWETVWGEESRIRNHYNELAVTLSHTDNILMVIRFRLYDDGLGLRYEFPLQKDLTYFTIKEEQTEFRLGGDYTAWWIPGDVYSEEYNYTECRVSEIPLRMKQATDYPDPRQFSPSGVQTSIQMRSDDGLYVNIHEAAVENYPGMHLDLDANTLTFRSWLNPDAEGWKGRLQAPCKSPWRTVMVTDDARKTLSSRLILNLNEPCALDDVSWIHPVKYMGVWWEMITGKSSWAYTWDYPAVELGVTDYSKATPNGVHGANNDNVKRYIDFASEHGFDGLLIEGWNEGWEDWYGYQKDAVFDFVTPYPDFDLPALNAYAHSKGIRLVMHHETSSSTINYERHIDEAFDLMKRYGYDAVKTGYVGNIIPYGEGHYSQPMVNHYNYVVRKAAKNHIMVNAHEAIRPTGLCRTWPNMIGNESAMGTEYRGDIRPAHVTVLPFTRLQGGPMDYTPGIFESDISRLNPASQHYMTTTLCKQLALYLTMYSPLQMAADLPEYYSEHLDAFRFIEDVAVDWEQSRYLLAEPGDVIVVARQVRKSTLETAAKGLAALPDGRKDYVNGATRFSAGPGDVWFVGGVTDENERTAEFPLDFLRSGASYEATVYRDAPDADGVAGIQPGGANPGKRYIIENKIVTSADSLSIRMARSGGFAISLKEKPVR